MKCLKPSERLDKPFIGFISGFRDDFIDILWKSILAVCGMVVWCVWPLGPRDTGPPRHWVPRATGALPIGPLRHFWDPVPLGLAPLGPQHWTPPHWPPALPDPRCTGGPPHRALLSFWVVYYTWLVHPVTRHCVRHVQVLVVTWLIS